MFYLRCRSASPPGAPRSASVLASMGSVQYGIIHRGSEPSRVETFKCATAMATLKSCHDVIDGAAQPITPRKDTRSPYLGGAFGSRLTKHFQFGNFARIYILRSDQLRLALLALLPRPFPWSWAKRRRSPHPNESTTAKYDRKLVSFCSTLKAALKPAVGYNTAVRGRFLAVKL